MSTLCVTGADFNKKILEHKEHQNLNINDLQIWLFAYEYSIKSVSNSDQESWQNLNFDKSTEGEILRCNWKKIDLEQKRNPSPHDVY